MQTTIPDFSFHACTSVIIPVDTWGLIFYFLILGYELKHFSPIFCSGQGPTSRASSFCCFVGIEPAIFLTILLVFIIAPALLLGIIIQIFRHPNLVADPHPFVLLSIPLVNKCTLVFVVFGSRCAGFFLACREEALF